MVQWGGEEDKIVIPSYYYVYEFIILPLPIIKAMQASNQKHQNYRNKQNR